MAIHTNLKDLFIAIANAIRTKTGGTDPIVADDFPAAIEGIIQGDEALATRVAELETANNELETANSELTTWKADNEFGASVFEGRKKSTNWEYLFSNCISLTTVPLLDTSHVTRMHHTFVSCKSLITVPLFDTSNVDTIEGMFMHCTSLTTVPLFDTSKVTNMFAVFYNCPNLTTVPLFDTSKVDDMYGIFYNCTNLTTVPLFDTSKVTSMAYMFSNCSNLTTIPRLDMRIVSNTTNMFLGCTSLTECWLRNIKTNLEVSDGSINYSNLLTVESLIHLIKECRDTGSTKTLTIGSVNMEKIANVYVKLVDITDEMRAEDDLIDEKLPFEVCESTDEGAMLITEYVGQKNWALA